MKHFVPNTQGLKVKTPTGYKEFAGIAYMGDKMIYQLILSNGLTLECSEDHKIYDLNHHKILLTDLTIGSKILIDGSSSTVMAIVNTGKIEPVYDLIEVADEHRYYTDSILSSNCIFVGEESTLINSETLQKLNGVDPIFKNNINKTGDIRWFDKIYSDKTYLIALDPSAGVKQDSACIQVWSLPDMAQIAEWSEDHIDIPNQVKLMQTIINSIHSTIKKTGFRGDPDIYYTIENNSWGEAALQIIADIGEEHFLGQFLHEPKRRGASVKTRKGLNTNGQTKAAACAKLKRLVETNRLKIKSKLLVKQLKLYVAKGNSFSAKSGEHDDTVMATMLCVRMMQMITRWDERIGEILKDVFDDHTDTVQRDPLPFSMMIR